MNIIDCLGSYLIASNVREESTKDKKFYVSDMGKCHRVRFLKRKGITSEFPLHVYHKMKQGNDLHAIGYEALNAQGFLLGSEEEVENEHFKGRLDGRVSVNPKNPEELMKGGEMAIFDWKLTNPWNIKKYDMGGSDNEENILQVLTYVKMKKVTMPDLLDLALLGYINHDPGARTSLVFGLSRVYRLIPLYEKKIEQDMEAMINYWVDNKIPPCTCPAWMRDYNSFLPLCMASETKLKKILVFISKGNKFITTNNTLFIVDKKGERKVIKI